MTDLLGMVADWEPVAIGVSITGATGYALHRILVATRYERGAYERADDFNSARLQQLEDQVNELQDKVTQLEADYRTQRQLKHEWRSFSSSLLQERWTIRRFAEMHGCTVIVELMDRLDELRRDNPLMADADSMASWPDPEGPPS